VISIGRSIRKWLYRFNHGGLDALCDKQRSDKGIRDVPATIADAMFELRRKHQPSPENRLC
jgi:putative transposase